jgi:hypothetical protein
MRAVVLATPILAGVLISSSLIARAEELAGPASTVRAGVPIVDVQPRADGFPTVRVQPRADGAPVQVQPREEDFRPHSAASNAEQERLSVDDAKQRKLDDALNRKLDICRC